MDFRNLHVKGAVLADLIGVTPRQVLNLANDGILRRVGRDGKEYCLRESLRAYVDHCRKAGAKFNVSQERARLYSAQAELANMKRDALAGKIVTVEDAITFIENDYSVIKERLLGVAARLASRLSADDRAAVEAEIGAALEELSDPQNLPAVAATPFSAMEAQSSGTGSARDVDPKLPPRA